MTIDPNKGVESPCKRTDSWAFVGYLEDGAACPIGVFSSYKLGEEQADIWMKSTPTASRWEGTVLYETLLEDDDE